MRRLRNRCEWRNLSWALAMALPTNKDARVFYRCAFQRFEEARVLSEAGFTTGAVYLAGYAVECMLKASILSIVSHRKRPATLGSFRGSKAHEFGWLREEYFSAGGTRFTNDVVRSFVLVSDWSTDLRYYPKTMKSSESERFLRGAEYIMKWLDGRL